MKKSKNNKNYLSSYTVAVILILAGVFLTYHGFYELRDLETANVKGFYTGIIAVILGVVFLAISSIKRLYKKVV